MAKAPPRQAAKEEVRKAPKAPTVSTTPEPSAFERMRDLTRRVVRVPKADMPEVKPKKRREEP